MADKDLTIPIKTTADTSGSEAVQTSLKDLDAEVKIIDANQTQSAEHRKQQVAEFAEWQKGLQAQSGGTSMLATDVQLEGELAEKEAARAAAKKTIDAAEAEALAIRIERGQMAARLQAEADLEQVLAAREKIALEEKQSALVIQRAMSRAALPESRFNEAGRMILRDQAALASLVNPATIAAAALVALGAASEAALGPIAKEMDAATAAGSKFAEQNIKTAATLSVLGSPIAAVKDGWSRIFSYISDGAKSAGETVVQFFEYATTKIGDETDLQAMRRMASEAKVARAARDQYEQTVADHAAMTKKLLADQISYQAALDNLARGREQRAGVGADQSAANEIARLLKSNADHDAQILAAINAAQIRSQQATKDLYAKSIARTAEEYAALKKTVADSDAEAKQLADQLATSQRNRAPDLINKVEAAQDSVQKVLEDKLTANAQTLQTQLQAVVDAKGKDASAGTRAALKTVNDLLATGNVTQADATKLQGAATQFYQSVDSNTQSQRTAIQGLITSNQSALDNAKTLSTQLATNTTAVATTTTETRTAIDTHQTATVDSIKSLAPTQADTQAIATAGKDTAKAITDQSNAFLAALTSVTAVCSALTQQVNHQRQVIDNLASRIR